MQGSVPNIFFFPLVYKIRCVGWDVSVALQNGFAHILPLTYIVPPPTPELDIALPHIAILIKLRKIVQPYHQLVYDRVKPLLV